MKKSKSQKSIIAHYIEIRKKKPLEKITVTYLCKEADVNKSTFYVYYKDIYDLADKVENEVVKKITHSIKHTELAFEEVTLFTDEVFKAYSTHETLINTLFSGNRSASLPQKLYNSLTELLFELRPEYKNSPEKHIMFAYTIYGSYYAYQENKNLDPNYVISVISSLTKL